MIKDELKFDAILFCLGERMGCALTELWPSFVGRPLLLLLGLGPGPRVLVILIFLLFQPGPAVGLSALSLQRTNTRILDSHILQSLISVTSEAEIEFALRGEQLDHILPPSAHLLRRAWSEASSSALQKTKTATRPVDAGFEFGRCSLVGGVDELWRPTASVESVLASAFRSVVSSHALHGIGETRMSRYDLYHGHLIRSAFQDSCALAILFHAAEYPANDCGVLTDVDLGHCQCGSDRQPSLDGWRYRNVLWASWWPRENGFEQIYNEQAIWLMDGNTTEVANLRVDESPFGVARPNAIWEGYLGECLADIYCLDGTTVWMACH